MKEVRRIENKKDLTKEEQKIASKKMARKCPRCGWSMRRGGYLRAGPRGGARYVYYCPECGLKVMERS
jgi:predicted RNA-binding Zn-ribbon protein involved in translation (DUF1610 family)